MELGAVGGRMGEWGMMARAVKRVQGPQECETCKNRRYQDVSTDPSVSFQSPTKIARGAEYLAVMGHEQEHVAHEQLKAEQNGQRVVSQTVSIHTSICPECGRSYVSGGTTKTTVSSESKTVNSSSEKLRGKGTGQFVDLRI